MNNQPIGILDSGVGGLSIWREIVSQLPHESTIYLADSKNCPYGNKSAEEIYLLAKQLVQFLVDKRVKLIVVACNTITVACLGKLREEFPTIPIVGTVPVIKTAVQQTKKKKIGILSTTATARSYYQKKLIKQFANDCDVVSVGGDKLVPMVEKGKIEGKEIQHVLDGVLQPFVEKHIDVLALGCSHFPFLKKEIHKILGLDVAILDSAEAIARQVRRVLANNNTLSSVDNATHEFYTTGDAAQFSSVASKLLESSILGKNMIFMGWDNKKIAVLGLGIEGVSSALYLKSKGAVVTVLDQKDKKEFSQATMEQLSNEAIKVVAGENYLSGLDQYDTIVRSPGIKRNLPQLLAAEKKGTVITSQTKLFFDLCPCPIIGVTGTKGKGTTASLIYEMLKIQGLDAYLGGNIGKPPFEFLDNLTPQSKVVLELSSFQLQDITKSPHIGVVLMITQEHLAPDKKDAPHQNFHTDIYEYIDAKRNIIRFQANTDFSIINRDYPASNESDGHTEGKVFWVSREREVEQGAFVKDKTVWLRHNGKEQKIIDAKEILLPGGHNLENVCAAVMAASLSGASKEHIVSVLKTFKGLEHRLELVGEVNGVRYYDDSFSTTPETAIAAIHAFKEPEILILGGAHKGSNFSELGLVISEAKNIKAIIGIGLEWSKIKTAIDRHSGKRSASRIRSWTSQDDRGFKIIEGAKNMHEIVGQVASIAEQGDVVLLSPACSSFDMFTNYKDRGEQFKKEVFLLSS